MYSGVVPQQPPTMFSKPAVARECTISGEVFSTRVKAAHAVRHTGVRIAADVLRCHIRQRFEIRLDLLRPQRAVEADAECRKMFDGCVEGFDGLAQQM
jgi:hypothetical protein